MCFLSNIVVRFRLSEVAKRVVECGFHGLIGAGDVRASGYHSDFVVETFDGASGDFAFGAKPIQQERVMGAQHLGDFLQPLVCSSSVARATLTWVQECI
jgi:hypothetical protein